MIHPIDIWVDFTSQDDTGLPWTLLSQADDPARIVPGVFVVAGSDAGSAVAEVVDIVEGDVVHLRPLPGPVGRHLHLLSFDRSESAPAPTS